MRTNTNIPTARQRRALRYPAAYAAGWVALPALASRDGRLGREPSRLRLTHWGPESGDFLSDYKRRADFRREYGTTEPSPEDTQMVAETLAWAEELWERAETCSDYEYNLAALARLGAVEWKHLGLAVSMVSAYLREQERLRMRQAQFVNEWVGREKERREFEVEVLGLHTFEGFYGTTTIVRMRDEARRCLVWFASNLPEGFKIGTELTIRGTIKKHDEWEGLRQTHLNRCALVAA